MNLLNLIRLNKYKHVISLGYNCEVSFNIKRYCKNLESSLFSWAYVFELKGLIKALNNLDDLFTKNIADPSQLYEDRSYRIAFHGNTNYENLLNKDGSLNQEIVEKDLIDCKSKINHLKTKFKKVLSSDSKKLFIYKLQKDVYNAHDDILELHKILSSMGQKFDLLIIVEEKMLNQYKKINEDNLYIRAVSEYNPEEKTDATTFFRDWDKIFKEFKLKRG